MMVAETIHITPEGELAAALEKAAEAPVILEANGIHYRLSREDVRVPDATETPHVGKPTSASDALWNIIGIAPSEEGEPTDVSQDKYRYLAEAYAPKPHGVVRGKRFTAEDALWNIVGIGQSQDDANVSGDKYRYLAEAYVPKAE
ncbi:MAG: hypothetical protein LC793_07085 [Thermomicrobia bacterium]|nr:hypothetical protein [Thermomicrobia bacterium]